MLANKDKYQVIGIGIGPANLSLDALLQPCRNIGSVFLDRKEEFIWHPGLLFSDAKLQVAYLKDLVSLVDPTSAYSFLEFLREKRRLYSFINANFQHVLRREFNEYFRWAAAKLPNLKFGAGAHGIAVGRNGIEVATAANVMHTQHLVVGTGLEANIPTCAEPYRGDALFHASEYLTRDVAKTGRRIVIVGGGQTGAEIFLDLLSDSTALPASVTWISRRPNFLPLDESPFVNEQFTPGYSDYFFTLPHAVREKLVADQKLTSDGISPLTLEAVYQRLYDLKFLTQAACACDLQPGQALERMSRGPSGFQMTTRHVHTHHQTQHDADLVIMCTGYTAQLPRCLEPIRNRINLNARGEYAVRPDFSIEWDGPPNHRIYVQNASRAQRGLADPNLSLLAWRSAKIVNSIAAREVYDIDNNQSIIEWEQPAPPQVTQSQQQRVVSLSSSGH